MLPFLRQMCDHHSAVINLSGLITLEFKHSWYIFSPRERWPIWVLAYVSPVFCFEYTKRYRQNAAQLINYTARSWEGRREDEAGAHSAVAAARGARNGAGANESKQLPDCFWHKIHAMEARWWEKWLWTHYICEVSDASGVCDALERCLFWNGERSLSLAGPPLTVQERENLYIRPFNWLHVWRKICLAFLHKVINPSLDNNFDPQ